MTDPGQVVVAAAVVVVGGREVGKKEEEEEVEADMEQKEGEARGERSKASFQVLQVRFRTAASTAAVAAAVASSMPNWFVWTNSPRGASFLPSISSSSSSSSSSSVSSSPR